MRRGGTNAAIRFVFALPSTLASYLQAVYSKHSNQWTWNRPRVQENSPRNNFPIFSGPQHQRSIVMSGTWLAELHAKMMELYSEDLKRQIYLTSEYLFSHLFHIRKHRIRWIIGRSKCSSAAFEPYSGESRDSGILARIFSRPNSKKPA